MRRAAILVHGILTDAAWSHGIGLLAPELESRGYTVEIAAWNPGGWGFLLRPLLTRRSGASLLARWVNHLSKLGVSDIVGFGHSHGAQLLAKASCYGAPFRVLVFINAAADRDVKIGQQVDWVLNYHTRGDKILRIASMLPFHPWGSLGKSGFPPERLAQEPRLRNYSMDTSREAGLEQFAVHGHSDVWEPAKLKFWGKAIVDAAEQALTWPTDES